MTFVHDFNLPASGKKCSFIDFRGHHMVEATRLMDGKVEMFTPALMHVVARVEGVKITMEEFLEMKGKDYMAITTALSEQGFI